MAYPMATDFRFICEQILKTNRKNSTQIFIKIVLSFSKSTLQILFVGYIRLSRRTSAVLSSTFEYHLVSESDYINQLRVQIDWTSLNKLLVSLRLLMDHNGTVSFAFWMWLCCHYNYIYTLIIRSVGYRYTVHGTGTGTTQ